MNSDELSLPENKQNGSSGEWHDIKYKQTFEDETRGIIRRRRSDTNCKIEDLQGILKSLYIMDGADIGGRGPLQDTIMAATIAAYEQYIASWKAEKSN